jgi:uncharacterized C2H2 Zn-finger protein
VINHLKTEITLNYILQAKFVPRSTHPDRVLKINKLMLYGERIAVCSEIQTKHVNKAELYYRLSPYRALNTPPQGFKNKLINAVWGKNRGFSETQTKHVNKAELYYRLSTYRAVNTPRQGFKNKLINAVWGKNRSFFEIQTKHVNKAELYYRLSTYRAVNTPRQGFKNL